MQNERYLHQQMNTFGKRQRLIKDGYDRMPAYMPNDSIKEVNSNNSNDDSNLLQTYDDQHL
jgi:hypothetical protein